MKYIGYIKWILMLIGASRGNLIGGIIGFTVGYFVEEFLSNNLTIETESVFKETEYKYSAYQIRLLSLISEVVKADGYIHKEEIYFIKNHLLKQFGTMYSNKMLKTLKLNIDRDFDVQKICLSFKSLDYNAKKSLVTFLHGITIQDKTISKKEQILIKNIAKLIGLAQNDYENIVSNSYKKKESKRTTQRAKPTLSFNAYKVLGISKAATDKEVKKAYRQMVLKFHPDKTDLADEIANEKFSEISKAYHTIKQARNLK